MPRARNRSSSPEFLLLRFREPGRPPLVVDPSRCPIGNIARSHWRWDATCACSDPDPEAAIAQGRLKASEA